MDESKFNKDLIYKLEAIVAKDGLTKIYEKDIANKLKMSPEQFSQAKKNNKIPYKYIIPFCIENNANINWVLDSSRELSDQEESFQYYLAWYKCRKNILDRINGKFNGKCGPKKIVSLYSVIPLSYKESDHKEKSKIKTKSNFQEQSNIFKAKYKAEKKSKIIIILPIVFWFIIIFFIGFFIGSETTKQKYTKKVYEDKIKKLEDKHNKLIKDIGGLIKDEYPLKKHK